MDGTSAHDAVFVSTDAIDAVLAPHAPTGVATPESAIDGALSIHDACTGNAGAQTQEGVLN